MHKFWRLRSLIPIKVPHSTPEINRQWLVEASIPPDLVDELYELYTDIRRKYAEIELKMYYSLITKMISHLNLPETSARDTHGWMKILHHMEELEAELKIPTKRSQELSEALLKWKQAQAAKKSCSEVQIENSSNMKGHVHHVGTFLLGKLEKPLFLYNRPFPPRARQASA
jgi:hypothetical protein